jgi:hypothetical protein
LYACHLFLLVRVCVVSFVFSFVPVGLRRVVDAPARPALPLTRRQQQQQQQQPTDTRAYTQRKNTQHNTEETNKRGTREHTYGGCPALCACVRWGWATVNGRFLLTVGGGTLLTGCVLAFVQTRVACVRSSEALPLLRVCACVRSPRPRVACASLGLCPSLPFPSLPFPFPLPPSPGAVAQRSRHRHRHSSRQQEGRKKG